MKHGRRYPFVEVEVPELVERVSSREAKVLSVTRAIARERTHIKGLTAAARAPASLAAFPKGPIYN